MANILVVDSSRGVRNNLKERLEYEGYTVYDAESTLSAMSSYPTVRFDLIICGDGCEPSRTSTPWIVISQSNDVEHAVSAMREGASDFVVKPINMNRLLESLRTILGSASSREQEQEEHVIAPVRNRPKPENIKEIVGQSPQIKHVKRLIDKVAPSDARVLITGANGTGKELVARWLHEKSHRKGAPFVEVNCAAIPSELIESELFGHEKGAFTSAVKQRKGKFEQASGGTLFLDEVGDMSLSAQAKVLRALQENRISRVGSDKDIEVDVRVLAATNKNLLQEIEQRNFREDLYHRLSVIVINVPPLSHRKEDIPLLINSFATEICTEHGIAEKDFDSHAVEELSNMAWTGNIRELHNVVERLIILGGEKITQEDVLNYV